MLNIWAGAVKFLSGSRGYGKPESVNSGRLQPLDIASVLGWVDPRKDGRHLGTACSRGCRRDRARPPCKRCETIIHELPTPRTTPGGTGYVRVVLTSWSCRHQRDADLRGAAKNGRGGRRPRRDTQTPRRNRRSGAPHLSANQLLKRARVLHALAALAPTEEQRAAVNDRADRVEGLAWDKALRHQVGHADLP